MNCAINIVENIKSMFKIDEKSLSNLQECLGETSSQSVVVAVDKYVFLEGKLVQLLVF